MDARELHEKLGVKEYFTTWAKRNILEVPGFTEGFDFLPRREKLKDGDVPVRTTY
ncbi:hypothetical protein GCM10017044_05920 [Kordiimonas sediminis]|uniref:AntA/AntB antirepressor domain-containing protein n=1 Tax=Kordiimonas sediminis TaxID=1735581 RepID=A0A919E538_9PROT|nr:hypothetical protein GCM10017044_05920 [Kordiimonas sediminis]